MMHQYAKYLVSVSALLLAAVGCESAVRPEADPGPGEPVVFAVELAEGDAQIGPVVYSCKHWTEHIPPDGDVLYLDLIHAPLDELGWFTERGAEILHVFEASDVMGTQVRIRLPRDRMDEWRRALPPMSYALGVVNVDRHDVVFRGFDYFGDETELREAVAAAGGEVVGRMDFELMPSLYTIILPDAQMKSFAEGVGAGFMSMHHRGYYCLDG